MNLRSTIRHYPTVLLFACLAFAACKKSDQAEVVNPQLVKPEEPRNESQTPVLRLVSVDSANDPVNWAKIISAFGKELQPDMPSPDPNESVYKFKQIARAWRVGDAAIVVLETRSDETTDWDRVFELYNFNIVTNTKTPITAKWSFWLWKFRKLATFESGPSPDITFETVSCTECEPVIILSALHFDEKNQSWKLRRWTNGDEGIAIYDTEANVDGSNPDYAALSGIADFQAKGFEQVAVWFRYREFEEKNPDKILPTVTTVDIFGSQNGAPTRNEVKDKLEISRIKKMLCEMNPSEDACKKSK